MKHILKILAAAGLVVIGGAVGSARAGNTGATLYTSAIQGTSFHCNIVNVGTMSLSVTVSVIGADGVALSVSDPTAFPPGTEAGGDYSTTPNPDGTPNPTDGYCKYEISGTSDRNQVRAALNANQLRTIPGTDTLVWLSRVLEAH